MGFISDPFSQLPSEKDARYDDGRAADVSPIFSSTYSHSNINSSMFHQGKSRSSQARALEGRQCRRHKGQIIPGLPGNSSYGKQSLISVPTSAQSPCSLVLLPVSPLRVEACLETSRSEETINAVYQYPNPTCSVSRCTAFVSKCASFDPFCLLTLMG
ncbi:hypothetical protein WJX74_010073 [Apatococcus lobatus]|uniref:Uncharacterized protein n=1 Tax=Apatococcus lobatus TaxID=904363 RepID=A0AAW1SFI6_9CHLO